MEGVVPGVNNRAPKHARSETTSAGRTREKQTTPKRRAATTAIDKRRDEEIAWAIWEEQEWGWHAEADNEAD